jgi:RNA-binding protein
MRDLSGGTLSELRGSDRRYLRGLGNPLRPVVIVGKQGASAAVCEKLRAELEAHELVKVRLAGVERDEREALCEQLAAAADCTCVGRVGGVALFYRAHPDPKRRCIALPGRGSP